MIVAFNLFEEKGSSSPSATPMSLTTLVNMVKQSKIGEADIKGDKIIAYTKDGQKVETYIPKGYTSIIDEMIKDGVKVKASPSGGEDISSSGNWLVSMLISWFPVLLFAGIWILMMRQMGNGGPTRAFSFGKSKAKVYIEEKPNVKLDNVAGMDEVKEEVAEVIEYLKDPARFRKLGGRPPKGILFYGEPGVGKTLLAKALAGEAHVPFISVSGSDFVEMFVGVGAARMRDTFETARKNAPCIVFIDEIDAVGRTRGAINLGGNDEREQTLNQLLVEMDGFDTSEGILIIAATNRPDILDPALLRPGRFDRQIFIPKPDVKGRYEILKVHAKNKPLAKDVDLELIARATPGFTGADLENILNEAALLAARKRKDLIHMEDLEEAIDRVMMGLERRGMAISPKEKEKIAVHEAGHALMGLMMPNADPLHKVSIIPRGMALGVTTQLPLDDKHIYDKADLLSRIHILMGGRCAEEVFYGKDGITTGAENDLQRATDLAYRIVATWGMSENVGPISVRRNINPFLGGSTVMEGSPDLLKEIDKEVQKLLASAYEETKRVIAENKEALSSVVKRLIEKETIDCKEFVEILSLHGVEIKNACKQEESLEKKENNVEPKVDKDVVNI
ncbi:ATP-dependent metalloprotease FtsH [Hydrogenobaculum sp. SN]|nr:ATP-dependent metalloprotease FtsH [Hydrogenobaculum sp. SN]